ncbi:hypothetical protein [Pseudomonas sp. NCCP-436]|uniref:hypothetical protein n=1 Tax=Pseudomonas sp. NCCP-436 TaxID=2842481 RepID=UPI001C7F2B64|nr:hypothetical protein [Pseudomonas sp. NCCP-436]GIZ11945.1 hypothetical protein NCCP436_13610 [Pseudomonas sp. NCCP-436]
MRILPLMLMAALLAGCDNATTEAPKTTQAPKEAQATAKANVIYLPDNTGLELAGRKVSDREVTNERGKYRRISIVFNDFKPAEIDKSVATILKQAGYKRKERSKDQESMHVLYRKKDVAPVTARYKRVLKEGQKKAKVTLSLTWKVN